MGMNDGGYESTACPDCVVTRCQLAGATACENQLNEPDFGLLAEWEAAEADCGATTRAATAKTAETAETIVARTRRPRPARARTRPHDSRSTPDPPLLAREVLVAHGTQRMGSTLEYGKRHRRDVRRRQKEFESDSDGQPRPPRGPSANSRR